MDEATQIENTPNKPIESTVTMDIRSAKLELSSPVAPNMNALDRYLDTNARRLFSFLKIVIFMLLLLAIIFIFIKIYTEQGVVILPFEISKNENLSSIAIADELIAELIRIQQIHNIKYEEVILATNSSQATSSFSTEQSLGNRELVVPKREFVEFSMANLGTIDIGSNSLALGNIIIAFKNICPGSKPVTIIRGSLQRYGSTTVLVTLLEGSNVQSWMVRQPIDNNNEEQFHEMIRNMAFMIAHDLPQSNISAKTWEGLKYYTEALDAYHQYKLSGNPNDLSLAGNYSLKAISSEKGYKDPFYLLSSLESTYAMIGRQDDAIVYCNKAIELDPTSTIGWNNKGSVLIYQGAYDNGIQAYDEAIRLDPKYAPAWNNKGSALIDQKKYDEAINASDEAIRLDPKYASAWNNKGVALSYQGKYDEAIKAFDEAIRLDAKSASAWNNKGSALGYQGKYDESIKACDEAIRLDPKYAPAWSSKGVALSYQGKYDEAINASDEAIRLDPKYAPAWNNKGVALSYQGKYDEAIKAFDEAIRLDPKSASAWNNKGFALISLKKYDEAIKAFDEAIRLDAKSASAWNNKGSALMALGRISEANAAFAKAKELGYMG